MAKARKRIKITPRWEMTIKKAHSGEVDLDEHEILTTFADFVLEGREVDQRLEAVAIAVMTKAIVQWRLPSKPTGRKKNGSGIEEKLATEYYKLRDAGASYQTALDRLVSLYPYDERHIMRLVRGGKARVGDTPEARLKKAEWLSMCAEWSRRDDGGLLSAYQRFFEAMAQRQEPDARRARADDLVARAVEWAAN